MRKNGIFRKKYYSGRLENSWDLEYFHSLSGLGTQIREAPASRILEAGASRAAFPSRSLGTSINIISLGEYFLRDTQRLLPLKLRNCITTNTKDFY